MDDKYYFVKEYDESLENIWDEFVEKESVNGTFLQTRRFLNYHPKDRFIDNSLMIYDKKNHIAAVCPAVSLDDDGEKIFYSHLGSTFGGIIINKKYLYLNKVLDLISVIEDYCLSNNYKEIVFKQTSDIFSSYNQHILEFAFYHKGYSDYKDLNLYVDFNEYKENILSNFSQGKRTNVNNCIKSNLEIKKIINDIEIYKFYELLCHTLDKYERKPVHTYEELLLLKNNILSNEIEFYGAYLNDTMIAGSMMFYFKNSNIAHTQYLAASHEYDTLSPMTFMYYSMIKCAKENGFDKVSFGISTENHGKFINSGLTASKEAFGAKHSINKTYYKKF